MPQRARLLPAPTAIFNAKKESILRQLAAPEGEYADASPKGSVDVAIRPLLDDINGAPGFVTTSSCAGRVSVFLEGRRGAVTANATANAAAAASADDQEVSGISQTAGVGGKGAGGTWLFVSHEPVPGAGSGAGTSWLDELGWCEPDGTQPSLGEGGELRPRLIRFKFEPMILHVLTASTAHAQLLISAGLGAGFRESGAVSISPSSTADAQPPTPVVAIRSLGLAFESLIGHETPDGQRHWLVSAPFLETLRAMADERFAENTARIQRFRDAFLRAVAPPAEPVKGLEWEDAAPRDWRGGRRGWWLLGSSRRTLEKRSTCL